MAQTSDVSGTSYQRPSTYLFVPNGLGADNNVTTDDTNTPGAYFRLGSYSDVEGGATSTDLQKEFYPRQHITDVQPPPPVTPPPAVTMPPAVSSTDLSQLPAAIAAAIAAAEAAAAAAAAQAAAAAAAAANPAPPSNDAITQAAGKDAAGNPASGIMLACNGRLLIRSGEATYLHSTSQIHIDTEDKFTLKVAKTLDITSGDDMTISVGTKADPKDLTMTVGGGSGTLTQTAKESKLHLNGNDFKYVTKDSFTYYQCNIYTYKLGGIVDVNMGGRFAYWAGSQLSINTSIDLTISLSPLLLYFFKADIGIFKMDICERKIELKLGKIDWGVWNHKGAVAKTTTTAAKVSENAVTTATNGVDAQSGGVQTWVKGVVSSNTGPTNNISAVTNNM